MEEDIKILEEFIYAVRTISGTTEQDYKLAQAIENLLKERQEDKEKIKELEKELEEQDMQHDLELIGKEEYTKEAMGEIIEHYYTANEDCIPKSLVREKIEELDKQKIKMEKNDVGIGFTLGKEWSDIKAQIKGYKELLESDK